MSYLPREEQPLSNIYPDLDIHSSIPIKIISPENDESNEIPPAELVHSEDPVIDGNRSQNDERSVPTIKETRSIPFDVPIRVGGTKYNPGVREVVSGTGNTVQPPHFDELYASAGYGSISPRNNSYTRPDASLQVYQPFVSSVNSENVDFVAQLTSPSFKVEYDLDEQDVALLGLILVKFRKALNAENLEIIMSMLDVCAATILWRTSLIESQKDGVVADASRGSMVTVHSNGEENDNPCVICNSPDFNDSNSIVFCDGCDISVHQDCYGVPNIPEGFWFCKKCEAIRESGDYLKIQCELCPFTSGAFKRSTNNKWVHMVCALYTPRVKVPSETGLLEPIQNLDKVESSRYALKCYVCNEKVGSCIQCCTRGCFKAFHPTCARVAGFYMSTCDNDMSEMLKQQDFLPVYCDRHSANMRKVATEAVVSNPVYSSPLVELPSLHMTTPSDTVPATIGSGIQKVRALLKQEKDKLYSPRKSLFATERHENVYWRTPTYNTLIFPQSVVPQIQQSLKSRFGLDLEEALIEFICRYWTIKKDIRDGVMFNKRLNLALEVAALRVVRPEKPENKVESPQNMLNIVKELLELTRSYLNKDQELTEKSDNSNAVRRNYLPRNRERGPRPTRSSRLKAMDASSQPPQPKTLTSSKGSIHLKSRKNDITKNTPKTTVSQDRRAMKRSRSTAFHFEAPLIDQSKKNKKPKAATSPVGSRSKPSVRKEKSLRSHLTPKSPIAGSSSSEKATQRARRRARPSTSAISEKSVSLNPNSKVLAANKSDAYAPTPKKRSITKSDREKSTNSSQKNKPASRPGRALRASRSAAVY